MKKNKQQLVMFVDALIQSRIAALKHTQPRGNIRTALRSSKESKPSRFSEIETMTESYRNCGPDACGV